MGWGKRRRKKNSKKIGNEERHWRNEKQNERCQRTGDGKQGSVNRQMRVQAMKKKFHRQIDTKVWNK